MNPITQPVNIYNTLGRNPYEPNYETLKFNQEIQSQEPVKIQTPINLNLNLYLLQLQKNRFFKNSSIFFRSNR